jgi:crotonobetainyl-CoA:carnitine CoA-transferase CaiB-like acyl-CoA transferase
VGPLDGVTVLALTSVIMGPYATQILGDLGADVVSIESADGDTNRSMGTGPLPGLSGSSMNLLRNKRSVVLDLKDPTGREAALRLAARSDVVVTNLRPGPLARLGLAYEDLRQVRPDVVFCRASGFPADSAEAEAPAYDDIIQSASGVSELFTRVGLDPMLLPTLVADKVSGLTLTYAILAALFHRERTGEGQEIEVPMVRAMRSFVLVEHGAGAIPEPPVDPPGYPRILTRERRPQRTVDGWINVLPYQAHHYDALFRAGGREDLVGDPRYETRPARIANSEGLYRDVAAILAGDTTEHWMAFCTEHGIPAARTATLQDLMDELPLAEHPHAGTYRVIPPPVRFATTPASVRRPAPMLGEQTREVLAEIGYDADEIDAMARRGVLGGG